MEGLDKKEKQPVYFIILIFIVLSAGIVAAGYLSYQNYENQRRLEVERQLSTITDLKVSELAQWRKERLGDAAVFYGNNAFSSLVHRYFNNPNDLEAQGQLWTWLSKAQILHSYERLLLFDARGILRMSVPDSKEPVAPNLSQRAAIVMRSEQINVQDFYRDELNQRIYLAIMTPLLSKEVGAEALGTLVLRIDPETYLYPLISRWPTQSQTAETLLVRREGNEAVFLNNLRLQKDAALNLRVPLEKVELPAVKAILAEEGIVEGKDYRGVPVAAVVRSIPDSPWFLVARMDLSEVHGPVKERLWLMIVLVVALIIGIGTGIGLVWWWQNIRFYREKYEATVALMESEKRYRNLYESLRDGVAEVDMYGMIIECNKRFLDMLGYSFDEVGRLSYGEITPERWHIMEARIIKEQVEVYGYSDLYEKEYMRKDGTVFPIELQTYLVRNIHGDRVGYWAFIRDISCRKQGGETLRESEEQYRTLVENASDVVFKTDNTGHFTFVNPAMFHITGYEEDEIIGKQYSILIRPDMRDEAIKFFGRQFVKRIKNTYSEYPILTKDGHEVWLGQNTRLIVKNDHVVGFQAVARDLMDRKRMEAEILALSITDQLTGLHNRRGFLSLAAQQLKLSDRNKRGVQLYFADLDGLKWINDTLGHEEGDKALIEAATIFKETFRTSDIIARLGGDEYAALAIDITEGNSEIFTARLQSLIDTQNNQENRRYRLSISVGCSYYDPENPCSIHELMASADKLMYGQKQNKKGLLLQGASLPSSNPYPSMHIESRDKVETAISVVRQS